MGECLITRRGGEVKKLPILNTAYPQDTSVTVIKGNTQSATFTVLIAEPGNPPEYSYQWYVDGVAVAGATEQNFTKSDIKDAGTHEVYCEVMNEAGAVTSRVAKLSVTQLYPPTLNGSYPADVSNYPHQTAAFTVSIATAGNPSSYTYQWYLNGSAVPGATDTSYTVSKGTGTYSVYCKVTNSAGSVNSRTATFTVNNLDVMSAVSWGVSETHTSNANVTSGKISVCHLNLGSSNSGSVYSTSAIDLTNYKTLTFYVSSGGATYAGGTFGVTSSKNGSFAASKGISGYNKTLTLDVSNLSGSYYFKLYISGNGTTDYERSAAVSNIILS